ncbi:MAG: NAD kinase [Prevotella sp.]|nr:NAD kinase [Prevotella sp.]
MQKKLRFALFGNEFQAKNSSTIQKVSHTLSALGGEVVVEPSCDEDFHADFAISIGGDGTFLKTASLVGTKGIPIIGVNIGRLGFLADVRDNEIEEAFKAIDEGRYRIEEHAVIGLQAEDLPQDFIPFALNDIAVLKRDNASMMTIHAYVDGDPLVTYRADGLVVSTPTGSTAYNLSNGGPIMISQAEVLCLTPVAPHSLNIRPIVVPDNAVVELEVESRSHNFLVAVDGCSETLDEQARIRISKASHKVKIVKRESENFFSTLREKMMWGKDGRN